MKHIFCKITIMVLLVTLSGVFSTGVFAAMQGFEGEYVISDPDDIIEIIVSFVTPSVVELQLMQEGKLPMRPGIVFEAGVSLEEMALAGHARFRQQLGQILNSDEYEIFDESHYLANLVYMRVQSSLVELIAELPEVSVIEPHIIAEPPNITSVTAGVTIISSSGGKSIITLVGTNLANNITVTAFDGAIATAITGTTTGDAICQTVELIFPANNSTTNDKVYSIMVSLDGGSVWNSNTATVRVSSFGEVAKTGVPHVTGIAVTMLILFVISTALWGYILFRKFGWGYNV